MNSLDHILAYAVGEDCDAEAIEELAFENPWDPALATLVGLDRGLRNAGAKGLVDTFVLPSEIAQIRASTYRVVEVEAAPIWRTDVREDYDILILRLPMDLRGVTRVDITWDIPGFGQVQLIEDARFEREAGAVFLACCKELAKRSPPKGVARAYAVEPEGRRLLAEYDWEGHLGH